MINIEKMKLTPLILMLFFSISFNAQNCCDFKLDKKKSIKQLGYEYQQLRNYKNRDCCNKYGSNMMKIMEMLSNSLDLGVSQKTIIRIMGEPDKYVSKVNLDENNFIQLKEAEIVLIYYWRGNHDFLYFGIKKNKLIYKNWYYALE